jgi:putative transposase
VSWGYRLIHTLLQREGWGVNHKLVYRLYREEGLTLRRRRRKRRRSAVRREQKPMPTGADQRWAMDFVHDTLSGGGMLRIFGAVDLFTRECVALRAGAGFSGAKVAEILSEAGAERASLPDVISVDNGTEFTSKALDHWAYWNRVELDFSRPGKPTDNAHIEAFNSVLRRECLSQHWFIDLEDAQRVLDRWRADYNNFRPHGSLARSTPADFAAGALHSTGPEELENSQI